MSMEIAHSRPRVSAIVTTTDACVAKGRPNTAATLNAIALEKRSWKTLYSTGRGCERQRARSGIKKPHTHTVPSAVHREEAGVR